MAQEGDNTLIQSCEDHGEWGSLRMAGLVGEVENTVGRGLGGTLLGQEALGVDRAEKRRGYLRVRKPDGGGGGKAQLQGWWGGPVCTSTTRWQNSPDSHFVPCNLAAPGLRPLP